MRNTRRVLERVTMHGYPLLIPMDFANEDAKTEHLGHSDSWALAAHYK